VFPDINKMASPTNVVPTLQQSGFKGDVLVDGMPEFAGATDAYGLNYAKKPHLVLLPNSPEDVSLAVSTYSQLFVRILIINFALDQMAE